ncbi:glutathione S-transferase theta-4-like isoform X2 [Monodelphis domestica]|uniref:glutathione S-transferase theta-4-like isoform X2 n=1 Tax=Monodelphis domestica TaxID=13616 RepID=UPI0024E22847|nr:glutathione S-transferase theta-4-like isoform X2 [Monodelphis domestica]
MSLELYLDLISPPCRSIYVFAKMNNIRFDYFPVDLLRGDHHSKEFEAINMLKTVPVLKEGDFTLIESVAILLYLTRKYRTSIYWYPPDVQLRGLIDEYMAWQHDSIHLKMQKFLWSKLLIPLITGQEMPKEKQDELLGEVNVNVQLFTDHFLKDKPFIAGNIISLADLLAAMEMMQSSPISRCLEVTGTSWRQSLELETNAESPTKVLWKEKTHQELEL